MKKNAEPQYPFLSTAPMATDDESGHRVRVLIAEDDYAFRDLLLFAFENDGYEAVGVADGYALLETLGSSLLPGSGVRPFDLVVSDVRMPCWSGLAALEKLGHSDLVPPLIVITAFGTSEVRRRAEQAGALAVLDKPFDIQDLVDLSHRVIAKSPSAN
jgi:two-component system phosphate regulon response regulator PhoB